MAEIALTNAFILRDVLLRFAQAGLPSGAGDYEAHVSQAQFDPNTPSAVFKGLKPGGSKTFPGDPSWTCTLAYAQDWETPNSLSRFLFEHQGERIPCVFEPVKGGQGFEATLIISAGAIGGTVDAIGTATVTLGVDGAPEYAAGSAVVDNQWAVAITGTPTGGSYVLTFDGYKTAPIAFNAATSAVTAAINALSGVTGISGVTISGTAAAYTLVFPVPVTMAVSHTFTGGTTPAISATPV
jgi:hypothetical protein